MKTLYGRCAGLDVHKVEIVACLRKAKVVREVRRVPATTQGLFELVEWLESAGCTHVAMEATGVYWKPVWHMLEGHFALILANAAHVKAVPGRKSDVQHVQRIQAVLEEANVKLSSVITDILGPSGRCILKALIAGETDAQKLAALGSERLRCGRAALCEALTGRVREHHRFLLAQHLKTIEQLEESVVAFDIRIEDAVAPFRDIVNRLNEVPGLGRIAIETIIAEIGTDMTPFPTAGHLVSWAGLVPRLDESAGKRRSTRIKNGAPWLKPALVQAGWAAARSKNTYLQAQFLRLKARRGPKKAVIAVAASILIIVFHMLRDGTCYQDLGPEYFARRNPAKLAARLANRIRNLGYHVEISAAA